MQHWIRVEDRLPGHYDEVLIFTGSEIDLGYYDGYVRKWYYFFEGQKANVTHWMPLPDPPKP